MSAASFKAAAGGVGSGVAAPNTPSHDYFLTRQSSISSTDMQMVEQLMSDPRRASLLVQHLPEGFGLAVGSGGTVESSAEDEGTVGGILAAGAGDIHEHEDDEAEEQLH